MMLVEKLFLVGTHRYSFRPGEEAEILGVFMVTPEDCKPRPCFKVRFPDGKEDYVPIFGEGSEVLVKDSSYEFLSASEFLDGKKMLIRD